MVNENMILFVNTISHSFIQKLFKSRVLNETRTPGGFFTMDKIGPTNLWSTIKIIGDEMK